VRRGGKHLISRLSRLFLPTSTGQQGVYSSGGRQTVEWQGGETTRGVWGKGLQTACLCAGWSHLTPLTPAQLRRQRKGRGEGMQANYKVAAVGQSEWGGTARVARSHRSGAVRISHESPSLGAGRTRG
jgi:hypothetical protein